MAKLARSSPALTLLLATLTAIAPLSTDMFLPSLPSMVDVFQADVGRVQLTLSVYLLGFAGAHLFYGPTADRFGRRPALLIGLVLYVAASFACVFAPTIEALIAARFIQAIGACAGPVLGRTIVRDLHSREQAARMLSYISMTMGLAPTLAPIAGGYLQAAFDWRASFIVLTLLGGGITFAVWTLLAETLANPDPTALAPRRMLANFATLLTSRTYLGYSLACCFCFSGLFAFISGSSFVFVDYYGLSALLYGCMFGLSGFGFVAGATLGSQLAVRYGLDRLLKVATTAAALAGLTMAVLTWSGVHTIPAIIGPMVIYTMAMGIVTPQGVAGAISPFPHMAGVASALLGFLQMGLASLAGIAVGQLYDGTDRPMATVIAVMGSAGFVAYALLIWRQLALKPVPST